MDLQERASALAGAVFDPRERLLHQLAARSTAGIEIGP
jgi:hypothetical protein